MFSTFSHRLSRFSNFRQNIFKVVCCRIVRWGKRLIKTIYLARAFLSKGLKLHLYKFWSWGRFVSLLHRLGQHWGLEGQLCNFVQYPFLHIYNHGTRTKGTETILLSQCYKLYWIIILSFIKIFQKQFNIGLQKSSSVNLLLVRKG